MTDQATPQPQAQSEAQSEAPAMSMEMSALQMLIKAAEKYLAQLDEVARGPTTQYLQEAVTCVANALHKLEAMVEGKPEAVEKQ